jgi:hypothetical protein
VRRKVGTATRHARNGPAAATGSAAGSSHEYSGGAVDFDADAHELTYRPRATS